MRVTCSLQLSDNSSLLQHPWKSHGFDEMQNTHSLPQSLEDYAESCTCNVSYNVIYRKQTCFNKSVTDLDFLISVHLDFLSHKSITKTKRRHLQFPWNQLYSITIIHPNWISKKRNAVAIPQRPSSLCVDLPRHHKSRRRWSAPLGGDDPIQSPQKIQPPFPRAVEQRIPLKGFF